MYDYSQDGDEEALFKEVALGFLFLGAGKVIEKGFRAWRAGRAVDDAVEVVDDVIEAGDDVAKIADDVPYDQLGKTKPCFLAGTLVKTPNGNIEIEKIKTGDKVLSFNLKEGKLEEKSVVRTYNNWTDCYFEIKTESKSSINATSKHLFWVKDLKKWIPTKELAVGMSVQNSSGSIEKINTITKSQEVDLPTYNLEIEDYHNYFVGQFGVLVHNQNKPSLFQSTTKNNIEFYKVTDVNGNTVYVGQTQQGIGTRFDQHIAEGSTKGNYKKEWGNPEKFKVEKVEIPKKGPLTPYEAHVWEKHLIEESKANGNPLKNKANPIGETKYNKFKDLHNPC
ncbi:polymorphic toxin-type HINT domain-containing protein [Zobellia uliginosa]|uniref:polymorphic toxin-type HINT domain-containing protein n=1 Tax=Zobellia uliginosa TaxID=143224 RepID=UPI0015888199|nr:polymorphic toxin-type HINT domain-containing protein [Zobellia uliginosa]